MTSSLPARRAARRSAPRSGVAPAAFAAAAFLASFVTADPAHAHKRVRRFVTEAPAAGQCAVNYAKIADSVTYAGGPIMASVQVVPVFWTSAVDPAITAWAEGYLQTLVTSAYFDLLGEYDTTGSGGTGQAIGHGTALAGVTITPTQATGTTVDDSALGPELAAQIAARQLPNPAKDSTGYEQTLYVLFFPPGTTVTQGGGASCKDFCGYHSAYNNEFAYAVVPDMGAKSDCATGCSDQCTTGNVDVSLGTVSHEVAEAVTDPDDPPAWINPNQRSMNSEIGDICAGNDPSQTDTGVVPGTSIKAQYEWSQHFQMCLLASPDFDGGAPPDDGGPGVDGGGSSSSGGSGGSSGGSGSGGSSSGAGSGGSSGGGSGGSSGGSGGSSGAGSGGSGSGSGSGGAGSSSSSGGGARTGDAGLPNGDSSGDANASTGCSCGVAGEGGTGSRGGAGLAGLVGVASLLSSRRRQRRT